MREIAWKILRKKFVMTAKGHGAMTSNDPSVRKLALENAKSAVDVAVSLDCPRADVDDQLSRVHTQHIQQHDRHRSLEQRGESIRGPKDELAFDVDDAATLSRLAHGRIAELGRKIDSRCGRPAILEPPHRRLEAECSLDRCCVGWVLIAGDQQV